MVRRDGFVLEPVVPSRVLRAIPDNRDMEGASFIMSALSPSDIGGEELGLLSNTGIRSLIYVLPGGSSLTLEKARKLTVGERRKLGRVVNTAQEINNSTNPAARLVNVSQEIGDGIQYSEKFVGIKNPNEPVGKTTRWAQELLFSKRRKKPVDVSTSESRETVSFDAKRKLIKDIDRAMAHLSGGGSLSAIHPDILSEVIKRSMGQKSISCMSVQQNSNISVKGLLQTYSSSLGLAHLTCFLLAKPAIKERTCARMLKQQYRVACLIQMQSFRT